MGRLRVSFVVVPSVLAAVAVDPAAAEARPCSDTTPVIVSGAQWIIYTGDGPWELENLSCPKARRIAKRMISRREATPGWKCRHTLRVKRSVRGGTYIDDYGYRQWRSLVGWHRAD